MSQHSLAGACLTMLLLTGCANRSLAPEPIALDRATCAHCGMVISKLDHAAQAVYANADTRFYDDVGCLATDPDAEGGVQRFYVHTTDGEWIDVSDAQFVIDDDVRTPMGYGVVALSAKEGTRDPAAEFLTWTQLAGRLEERR